MPLARIDLIKGKPSDYRRTIGDVVYKAMVEILRAPENDRFQVINEHDADNFVYEATHWTRSCNGLSTTSRRIRSLRTR
jgi:4-oxalocrotonate tautomerase